MTTKAAGKVRQEPQPAQGVSREDMQTAYQVHTLAQMLYGQLAMTNPWIAQAHPAAPHTPFAAAQEVPWGPHWTTAVWGVGPMHHAASPTVGQPLGFVPYPMGYPVFPH